MKDEDMGKIGGKGRRRRGGGGGEEEEEESGGDKERRHGIGDVVLGW